jgi:hypothetical protein
MPTLTVSQIIDARANNPGDEWRRRGISISLRPFHCPTVPPDPGKTMKRRREEFF